jgi:Cu(I)/Ag(I) efflux system membrane fusion protein
VTISKIKIRLLVAVVYGLSSFIAISGIGCESSSRLDADIETPGVGVPKLIRQGDGLEVMQLRSQEFPGLTLDSIRQVDLPGVLETSGQISFDDRRVSSIISRVSGRIEEVRVSLWDHVQRGQPIVTLYSPDYMTAEAEYLQAKETAKSLAGGGSDNQQFARSMGEAARRKLELLGVEPDQIATIKSATPSFTVCAPIGGTVVQNLALRGAAVNPGDVLYSLGTLEDVWITGDIYEDDLARVEVGQRLEAITTAYPDQVFQGTIARISPNVDPNTHTLQIRCEVKNPGLRLKPQMLARVKIMVRPGQALIVPLEALIFETDTYFAYVDAGEDRLERRRVTIGAWNKQGYARVISGLQPGDRVVTSVTIRVNELWHEAHGEGS